MSRSFCPCEVHARLAAAIADSIAKAPRERRSLVPDSAMPDSEGGSSRAMMERGGSVEPGNGLEDVKRPRSELDRVVGRLLGEPDRHAIEDDRL